VGRVRDGGVDRRVAMIGGPLSIARRLLAAFIDFWLAAVVIYVVHLVHVVLGFTVGPYFTDNAMTEIAAWFLSVTVIFAVMLGYAWVLGRTGRSVGKRVVGGRVVRVDGRGAPGFGRALGRTGLDFLLTIPFFFIPLLIAYAVASARSDRMAIQDLATGTHPVRVLKRSEAPARSTMTSPE
jgi:uncharacterized RDD family membrane protein YckC